MVANVGLKPTKISLRKPTTLPKTFKAETDTTKQFYENLRDVLSNGSREFYTLANNSSFPPPLTVAQYLPLPIHQISS